MACAYPMLLDVSGRLSVIVGGGAVAARKAAGLLAAGAERIRCVAPAFHADLPPRVERITADYAGHFLDGAALVFAATDQPRVNDAVVRDARRRGLLVQRVDESEAEPGDFSTPAQLRDGPVIIAVSAGSAALAAALRDDLDRRLDRRYVRMAETMMTLRPTLRSSGLPPERRSEIFRDLAGPEAIGLLASGGSPALNDWLARKYPELRHG